MIIQAQIIYSQIKSKLNSLSDNEIEKINYILIVLFDTCLSDVLSKLKHNMITAHDPHFTKIIIEFLHWITNESNSSTS